MKFYIADVHFGHENILRLDQRPFATADEMDEAIIANWNAVVGIKDDVYILGDFAYRNSREFSWYLRRLNGRKYLIVGNHDEALLADREAMKHFITVDNMMTVFDSGRMVVLCHYPIAMWNQCAKDSYHIYGHIHKEKNNAHEFMCKEKRSLNAGCMINQYAPATLDQMIVNNEVFKKQLLSEIK